VIIGGGLAGLTSAYTLAKSGHHVLLIEKRKYPFHRVCGEYLSNEVMEFLQREQLLPTGYDFPCMNSFLFSDTSGRSTSIALDLGGIGISRYVLDEYLFQKIIEKGAEVKTGVQVTSVLFDEVENRFRLELTGGEFILGDYVIGAFGKRSKVDKVLQRHFMKKRSPYIGVKYHIKTDFDRSAVGLHNFEGGYCGLNAIEDGKANFCYLGNRDQLRKYGSIEQMEREVLWKNPNIKHLFNESEFLFERPEVINEINFERKAPVEKHILMAGDAAGLITPLFGNGMAMAIQSGKFAAEAILLGKSRIEIEKSYERNWKSIFAQRLWLGRIVQKVIGYKVTSFFMKNLIQHAPAVANQIIQNSHGKPF
tara:strand:- start:8913 stop:10007 length:1095 start_codon:yes stop_codon:yes gene_type:complete